MQINMTLDKEKTLVVVPISFGELLDKLSILHIKLQSTKLSESARINVQQEYDKLKYLFIDSKERLGQDVKDQAEESFNNLLIINSKIWVVEDFVRLCEHQNTFDSIFLELARQVYILNDERAKIKKDINITTKSEIIEEKSHNYESQNSKAKTTTDS